MELIQSIIPLVGVALGASLSGFGAFLKNRKEKKKIISLALSNLLEIRHKTSSIDLVLKEISSRAKLSPAEQSVLQKKFDEIFPLNNKLHERYEAAVSLLAEQDPILAFELQGRDAFPQTITVLRKFFSDLDADISNFAPIEQVLRSVSLPSLDKAVLILARQHSLRTHYKVKKIIRNSAELPREAKGIFEALGNLE